LGSGLWTRLSRSCRVVRPQPRRSNTRA
jgi:hypothetical protein